MKDQLSFFEESDDEKDRQANELRNLIGRILRLAVFVDEVHHAVSDEITGTPMRQSPLYPQTQEPPAVIATGCLSILTSLLSSENPTSVVRVRGQ